MARWKTDVLQLDCTRVQPDAWDPQGLSTWDTANALRDDCLSRDAVGPVTVDVGPEYKALVAFQGPPLDRWLIAAMSVKNMGSTVATPVVRIELKIGLGNAVQSVVEGQIAQSATGTTSGPLVQLNGVLATRWEIWGRVDPLDSPDPVEIRFRCIFDRVGGPLVQGPLIGVVPSQRIGVLHYNSFAVTVIS